MRLVRFLLYLFETESNWKAHHKVRRAVSLECGSFNGLPKHYPWCDVDTKNWKYLPFATTGRPDQFSSGMHQCCRTESYFCPNLPSSGRINSLVMRSSLMQFGKTDGFHLRSRCGRLVLVNDKLVSALTFIIMLAMPTSVTNATKSNNS